MDSIDDFVKVICLIWLTSYDNEVVEENLKQGLNEELGKEWAKPKVGISGRSARSTS